MSIQILGFLGLFIGSTSDLSNWEGCPDCIIRIRYYRQKIDQANTSVSRLTLTHDSSSTHPGCTTRAQKRSGEVEGEGELGADFTASLEHDFKAMEQIAFGPTKKRFYILIGEDTEQQVSPTCLQMGKGQSTT
jgi:hypothetical protein